MSTSKPRSAWQRFLGWIGTWVGTPAGATDDSPNHRLRRDDTLRVVAIALGEPEADLIRQRLAEAEISSISRRVTGGPELGDAGARYVCVSARELARAQGILGSSA
jgi:hypothetical protein